MRIKNERKNDTLLEVALKKCYKLMKECYKLMRINVTKQLYKLIRYNISAINEQFDLEKQSRPFDKCIAM